MTTGHPTDTRLLIEAMVRANGKVQLVHPYGGTYPGGWLPDRVIVHGTVEELERLRATPSAALKDALAAWREGYGDRSTLELLPLEQALAAAVDAWVADDQDGGDPAVDYQRMWLEAESTLERARIQLSNYAHDRDEVRRERDQALQDAERLQARLDAAMAEIERLRSVESAYWRAQEEIAKVRVLTDQRDKALQDARTAIEERDAARRSRDEWASEAGRAAQSLASLGAEAERIAAELYHVGDYGRAAALRAALVGHADTPTPTEGAGA